MSNNTNTAWTWLFRLFNKGTGLAAWWLEIGDLEHLGEYLRSTDGRYSRAFRNYMHDSQYGTGMGHGEYPQEAPLTQLAYFHGLNRKQSIVEALVNLGMERAANMTSALMTHGKLYVNQAGGWNWGAGLGKAGGFVFSDSLSWPGFTEADIRITRFPDGRHWYARVGQAEVRDGSRTKFDTYAEAKAQAMKYLTGGNQ